MHLLILLVVGLLAGLLASVLLGGVGKGLLGDSVVGVCGALLGGWFFSVLEISVPFGALGGPIFIALSGASVFLLMLRVTDRQRRI